MSDIRTFALEELSAMIELNGETTKLPLQSLPDRYVDWIEDGRKSMYDHLLGKENSVPFFSQHLPVLVTQGDSENFPFNCCNKGVGMIPKAEHLEELSDLFRTTLEKTRDKPPADSIRERIEAVSKFYFDRDKIDLRALSTLEIFQRKTFENLSSRPFASLLFTGSYPRYTSFQLNCAVEILQPDDPRHTFIQLARNMFERDRFHITQDAFPNAYIFWISEVIDKTPFKVVKSEKHQSRAGSAGERVPAPKCPYSQDPPPAGGPGPARVDEPSPMGFQMGGRDDEL